MILAHGIAVARVSPAFATKLSRASVTLAKSPSLTAQIASHRTGIAVFAATSNPRVLRLCFATSPRVTGDAFALSIVGRALSTADFIVAFVAPGFMEADFSTALRICDCRAISLSH